MISLTHENRTTKNFEKKTKILKNSFFSFSFDADTENIQKFTYVEFKICPLTIIKIKIMKIIRRFKINKTANWNEVSNKILQFFFETLIDVLTSLYQICVNIKYHSITFKKINTMIFKKSNKKNYIIFKTYKSITLLNTFNKTLKLTITKKTIYLTQQHRLLFKHI